MSFGGKIPRELEELTALACDGELTDRETARLEELLAASASARRYYLLYLHLHGELHWQQAAAAEPTAKATRGRGVRVPIPAAGRPRESREARNRRLRLLGFVASAAAALALLVLAYRAIPRRQEEPPAPPPPAESPARLGGSVHARWATGAPAPAAGQSLPAERSLELVHGIVEIDYGGGSQLLIRAPARFTCSADGSTRVDSGQVTVRAVAAEPLAIAAPGATITAGGAVFGLAVRDRSSEVHVIEGEVAAARDNQASPVLLAAGQARSWPRGEPGDLAPITFEPELFVLRLPDRAPDHSVARLRSLVEAHPRLIHHYPFEGTSRLEKCRDKRGSLHLTEAVMADGRGRGSLDYTAEGFDLTTESIRPFRADEGGRTIGVGLQSEEAFYPPERMTVELLLQYRPPADEDDSMVGLAVATRDGQSACGFFVAAVGPGYLSLLFDAEDEWPELGVQLVPENWYYVAVTFAPGAEGTIVNAYSANLSEGDRSLRRLVEDLPIRGAPPASRLGIGKGFSNTDVHAYPWPGQLDEVAVYDAVLDAAMLQSHLESILPPSSGGSVREGRPVPGG